MPEHDLVIRNGTVADGSGAPSWRGDIAVDGDWIVAVGKVAGAGKREIDAEGLLVTPGFVDIHTHYDGQVIWSERLAPSSDHGVTTVLTGNCGIGFAPCRAADRAVLVELMEGVEDIPGAVADAGLTWDWESFPQYLDAIAARPHDIDIAALVPHSPLRVFVMGERGINREAATSDDLARMQALLGEALDAGAIGFGTSRIQAHRTSGGELIPSFEAAEEELHALGAVMRAKDHGIFQAVLGVTGENRDSGLELMRRLAKRSGRVVTYTQAQPGAAPQQWRELLDRLREANDNGARIMAQLFPRPMGLVIGLTATVNPFCMAPSWREIADLPLAGKLAAMRDPGLRRRLIDETPENPRNPVFLLSRRFEMIFEIASGSTDYEPPEAMNIAARAKAAGVAPAELLYDLLLENEGRKLLLVAMANYANYNLDFVKEMLRDDHVVVGLGDGGAHYGMVCDASYPTFMLTHWARDRERGRFTLEETVHYLSRKPAEVIGLTDRGLIKPGHRAHLNIIDLGRLELFPPEIVLDLPGGGKRFHQRAAGYVATIVNGQVIAEEGRPMAARPGRLLRGRQQPRHANNVSGRGGPALRRLPA